MQIFTERRGQAMIVFFIISPNPNSSLGSVYLNFSQLTGSLLGSQKHYTSQQVHKMYVNG